MDMDAITGSIAEIMGAVFEEAAGKMHDDRVMKIVNDLVSVFSEDGDRPISIAVVGIWMMGIQMAASCGQADTLMKDTFCLIIEWLNQFKPEEVREAQQRIEAEVEALARVMSDDQDCN
jgi:hypothetical protein